MKTHPLQAQFAYDHLAPHLQEGAKLFADLAQQIASADMADEAARARALRCLGWAKDAFLTQLLKINPVEFLPPPKEKDNG